MAISKTHRVFLLLALIAVFFVALIRASKDFFAGLFTQRPAATAKQNRPPRVYPIVDEDAKTAGLPLKKVLADLKFDTDPTAWKTFDTIIESRLRHEKFEDLDAVAEEYNRTKEKFPGGRWKIFSFHETLAEVPGGRDMPDSAWREHFDRFGKWMKSNPKSKTARVGYAEAMIEYAWQARGSGYANEVTRDGWRLFRERIDDARQTLTEAKNLDGEYPQWYFAMQHVALGQGWDQENYDQIFDEAVKKEPLYWRYYIAKAQYLLPRWHGQEGEWEAFAQNAADKVGGEDGDAVYYFITINQLDWYNSKAFFTQTRVSWPRMKSGYAVMMKKYHGTNGNRNFFCKVAGYACDHAEAQRLLKEIGENWDQETWGSKEEFEKFKAWANSQKKD